MNKILIIGAGYVGMSNGVYLSKENDVIFYDIDKEKNKELIDEFITEVGN